MSSSFKFSVLVLLAVAVRADAKSLDLSLETKGFDQRSASKESAEKRVCRTKECVEDAERVLNQMDNSTNPCDDFYTFACGGFIRNTILEGRESAGTIDTIKEERNAQIRKMLEEPISDGGSRSEKIAKTLYRSCMNVENASLLQHINILFRKLGGWPVVEGENWNDADFDWIMTTYKLKGAVFSYENPFVYFNIDDWNKNGHINIIGCSFLEDWKQVEFYNILLKAVIELGAERDVAKNEIRKVSKLLYDLVNICSRQNSSQMHDMNYSTSIGELEKEVPGFPWLEYINNILNDTNIIGAEKIVAIDPSTIKSILTLLSNTEKRTVANLMFSMVLQMHPVPVLLNIASESSDRKRFLQCVELITKTPLSVVAVGSVFLRHYFANFSKQELEELSNNIRDSFLEMISSADWLDEKSRRISVDKVKEMTFNLAYSEKLLDDTELDELYGDVEVNEETLLENILQFELCQQKYDSVILKADWMSTWNVVQVNAFYRRSLFINAGILHRILFDSNRLKYMNYGGIGQIVGHEITHGFDNSEVFQNLWEKHTIEKFDSKTRCFIKQYNNYTEPMTNMKLDGNYTRRENIADHGGLKAAYLAYRAWSDRQGAPEKRLPGLEWYTPRQMFWLAAAQAHCSKRSNELMTDAHSPDRFRVIGPFSNSKAFAEDFKCDSGTRMNPKDKCKLWK